MFGFGAKEKAAIVPDGISLKIADLIAISSGNNAFRLHVF